MFLMYPVLDSGATAYAKIRSARRELLIQLQVNDMS